MAKVYLKPGDKIDALCTLKVVKNTSIQDFEFVEINECASGLNFAFWDGENHFEVSYDFDPGPHQNQMYYDDTSPIL
jgi:hypothetical protein